MVERPARIVGRRQARLAQRGAHASGQGRRAGRGVFQVVKDFRKTAEVVPGDLLRARGDGQAASHPVRRDDQDAPGPFRQG